MSWTAEPLFKIISVKADPNGEAAIAYYARQSSSLSLEERSKSNVDRLIRYCAKHKHWSVFEHSFVTVEVSLPRWLGRQILRHRSFTFQEFSQRYAQVRNDPFFFTEARLQDPKNRQKSTPAENVELDEAFLEAQKRVWYVAYHEYEKCLEAGIAREQASRLLPELSPSTMAITGSVRSWIHFVQARIADGAQYEMMAFAQGVKYNIIRQYFPNVHDVVFGGQDESGIAINDNRSSNNGGDGGNSGAGKVDSQLADSLNSALTS